MTKQQITEAAKAARRAGEDLQLWQAIEWMHDYKLITYKEYRWFLDAQAEAATQEQQERKEA